MNMIEDRLRDAYRAAAETVEPGSIRPLADHISAISDTGSRSARRPGRWPRRLIIPMAAAAAVAAIAVLTTLIIPRVIVSARSHRQTPATAVTKFAVAMAGMPGVYSEGAKTLTIFNAISGTTVATVVSPRRDMYFAGVATGDGSHFVAELRRPGVCRTWLYQFRLGPAGRPGPLGAYSVRSIGDLLTAMAISKDGSTLAYAGDGCAPATRTMPAHRSFPAHLGVMHVAGGEARQWTLSGRASVPSLSLTAHGTLLAYDTKVGNRAGSAAYVLPTGAASGPAVVRSRLAVASGRFGRSETINSVAITPDGRQVYFTTSDVLPTSNARWQLRAVELATGHIRVVGRYAGLLASLSADPSVRYALVVDEIASASRPTPTPSASSMASPVRSPSASELPTPKPSPTGTASVAPTPSPGRARLATPTPSVSSSRLPTPTPSASGKSQPPTPSPSVSSSSLPTPTPSASGKSQLPTPSPTAIPLALRLELINLTTGRLRVVYPPTSSGPLGTIIVW